MKNYKTAPLPFQGQKRRFITNFREVIFNKPAPLFVDLFGGSGLLSHNAKQMHPGAEVVYNDYDDYCKRLQAIPSTNCILADLRSMLAHLKPDQKLPEIERRQVLERIKQEAGYVDYITLSASLLFSMNYVKTYDDLIKSTLYNKVRESDYIAEGYLEGVTVTREDYKIIFNRYKAMPGVVFLIDPPYLSTDCSSYENYWKLKDYLDVMLCLRDNSYIYFTSNKSNIVELCEWIETNTGGANPFNGATIQTMNAMPSYNTTYTDMMIYKYI
jgi:site-specific DNA-adenine methylase